jgi:hypothetical protein
MEPVAEAVYAQHASAWQQLLESVRSQDRLVAHRAGVFTTEWVEPVWLNPNLYDLEIRSAAIGQDLDWPRTPRRREERTQVYTRLDQPEPAWLNPNTLDLAARTGGIDQLAQSRRADPAQGRFVRPDYPGTSWIFPSLVFYTTEMFPGTAISSFRPLTNRQTLSWWRWLQVLDWMAAVVDTTPVPVPVPPCFYWGDGTYWGDTSVYCDPANESQAYLVGTELTVHRLSVRVNYTADVVAGSSEAFRIDHISALASLMAVQRYRYAVDSDLQVHRLSVRVSHRGSEFVLDTIHPNVKVTRQDPAL